MTPLKSFGAVIGAGVLIFIVSNWETIAADALNQVSDMSVGAGFAMFVVLLASVVAGVVYLAQRKKGSR